MSRLRQRYSCIVWWSAICFLPLLQLVASQPGVTTVRLGGSLSLTGPLAVPSQAVLRGVALLAETVNRTRCFRGPGNSTLALSLTIHDDQTDGTRVRKIYEDLTMQRKVNFLLGPYSSCFTRIAAERASNAKMIAVLPSGSLDSIYQKGFRYIFNVNAAARDYMKSGLETMWALGARTVSLAWDADEFHEDVCLGASQHADQIGYEVLGNTILRQGDLTTQVRWLRTLRADVCIICSGFQQSVLAVVVSRGLGFVPKGMLIARAASNAFISSVGAPNANYIMGPVPWTADANLHSCRVFGSSAGFVEAYRKRWGEEPTYQSAEGAAAGIALLAAVESASSLTTDAVNAAMLSLSLDSFYAHLAFGSNGRRKAASVFTQQVQPVAIKFVPGQRYQPSELKSVSSQQLPLWPMPMWQQKELEVYPCAAGNVWTVLPNTNQQVQDVPEMYCAACPVGRYRHENALACEDCEAGRYGDSEGLGICKVCPEGSECPSGFRPGQPSASADYYKLTSQPLKIMRCEPPELCLGSNTCLGYNTGVLCWQCEAGSSNKGLLNFGRTCDKCPGTAWNLVGASMILLYGLYIWVIAKATIASSRSVSGIHSVIMKITVSYLQLGGAIFEATEFDTMVNSMFEGREFNFIIFYVRVQSIFHNPLEALISTECVIGRNFRADKAHVLVGLTLIPVVLFLQITIASVRQRRRIISFQRKQEKTAKEFENTHSKSLTKHSLESRQPTLTKIEESERTVSSHMSKLHWHSIQMRSFDWVSGSIVWCFVLHAIVLRLLLTPLNCMDLDTLRLRQDLEIVCGGQDHRFWVFMSLSGIILYGFGVPLAFAIILICVRRKLFHPDVRSKFGFLYNGYELHSYYFESIYMLRKVGILGMAILPNMYMRLIGLAFLSYGFLFLHAQCEPFDNRGYFCLDRLEKTSLRALVVTVMSRLIFDIRSMVVDTIFWPALTHSSIDLVICLSPLVLQIHFVSLASWSLFRNTVLKTWHLKADLWPNKVGVLRSIILRADPGGSKVTLDEKDNAIDISALRGPERQYLLIALQDTLERYVQSDPMVHPGLVVNAIHEAFRLSLATRSAKTRQLVLLRVSARDSSWSSFFGRIGAEVRMSLKQYLSDITDADIGSIGARIPHGIKLDEVARLDAILKQGVTVEELYNHLMMLWHEVLERHPRFFDTKVLAARDEVKPEHTLERYMSELFTSDSGDSRELGYGNQQHVSQTEEQRSQEYDVSEQSQPKESVVYVDIEGNKTAFKLEGVWLNHYIDNDVILNHLTEVHADGRALHLTGSSAGNWGPTRTTIIPEDGENLVGKVVALHERAQALQQMMKGSNDPVVPDVASLERWNKAIITRSVHVKIENEALRKQIAEQEACQSCFAEEIAAVQAAQQAAEHEDEERQAAIRALREQIAEQAAIRQHLAKKAADALDAAKNKQAERMAARQVLDLDSLRVEVISTVEGLHEGMSKRRPKQRLRKPTATLQADCSSPEGTLEPALPPSRPARKTGSHESQFMGAMLQPRDPASWPSTSG